MNIQNIKSYAVVRNNEVIALEFTREDARHIKAKMGGKENGVRIVQMKASGEVR